VAWREVPIQQRQRVMFKLQHLIRENTEALAESITREQVGLGSQGGGQGGGAQTMVTVLKPQSIKRVSSQWCTGRGSCVPEGLPLGEYLHGLNPSLFLTVFTSG
jgi:hypothetical protein